MVLLFQDNTKLGLHNKNSLIEYVKTAKGNAIATGVELSPQFIEMCSTAYPVDKRILKFFQKSPLQMDIYVWLSRILFSLKTVQTFTWLDLKDHFGQNYKDSSSMFYEFKKQFKKALYEIGYIHGDKIKYEFDKKGLILYPNGLLFPSKTNKHNIINKEIKEIKKEIIKEERPKEIKQEITKKDILLKVKEDIKISCHMTAIQYKSWIEPIQLKYIDKNKKQVVLFVPSKLVCNWLERKYYSIIETSFNKYLSSPYKILNIMIIFILQ